MSFTFTGTFYGRDVSGEVRDDGTLDAPPFLAQRIHGLVSVGNRVSWANMTGSATLTDRFLAPATIEAALDVGTAHFEGLVPPGAELPDQEGPLAEAFGGVAARAKAAADQARVGGGHDTGGQFSKVAVPAIGTGGTSGGRPAVGKPGAVHPSTLFTPDGKTIFGHTLPPNAREATPEERKAARIPPSYPGAYVPTDGKELENGIVGWGLDSQGRIKRFYSDSAMAKRAKQKFKRVRALSKRLDALDAQVARDARSDDRAALAMLIRTTGMRPGSETKTGGAKQAFGATTLQAQHVLVEGDVVSFDFVGKNGKNVAFTVEDPMLAGVLGPRLAGKAPEDQVFPGVNERGVNAFIKGAVGPEFKTKDLRTVLATSTAQARVNALTHIPAGKRERQAIRKAIAEEISGRLGNTPAEVIKSYVDPGVWNALGL